MRPNSKPNLRISNLHTKAGHDTSIYYELAHSPVDKIGEEFEWSLPNGITAFPFDECNLEEGQSYAVWCEEVEELYTTNKGKKRYRKRFDWIWAEPLAQYEREEAPLTPTGRKLKQKLRQEKFIHAISILNELFDFESEEK